MSGMTKQYPGCLANNGVSLTVERNPIHALLGENGAGKSTLVEMIYGVVKPDAGRMGPRGRRRILGSFVPEERNGHAAVTTKTLAENAFLSGFVRRALVYFGVIKKRKTAGFADSIVRRFDVRTTGPLAEARSLSGGNLQKFLVGR
jgi:general nucleoside transport system ATP-binding protein